ncbi:MAG: hypothetical protein ABI758_05095 [Candidatus Woesebacteria bacterium]
MLTLIAQITNPVVPTFGTGPANVALTNIIVTVWRTAVTLGGLALLVMLVIGALEWITAGGDKGKIEAARNRITQSVIGMLVLVGTVAISIFIGGIIGLQLLNPNFADNLTGTPATNGGGQIPQCPNQQAPTCVPMPGCPCKN